MWLKGELAQQAGICQSDAEDSGGKGPWEQTWEVRVELGSFQVEVAFHGSGSASLRCQDTLPCSVPQTLALQTLDQVGSGRPLLRHFLVGEDGSEGFPGFWTCFVE